ncbi:MAG: hypothetical protein AAFV07_13430 [Bacteroidota bacterium]
MRILLHKFIWAILVLGVVCTACEEGALLDNQPPETRLFLDAINLEGDDRLNSVVEVHWLGEDQDGYVIGYEWSLDNTNWQFTTRTDSSFRFQIPPGNLDVDITLAVRAIDNQELRDPSPDELVLPIRNTPPKAQLDTVNTIPDTVLGVWATRLQVEDLDGSETLDSVFIKLNGGDWVGLDPRIDFLSFVASEPMQAGEQDALIYVGTQADLLPETLPGLIVDGENQLIIRARDIASTFSKPDTSHSFFVKAQGSDLLVLDSHEETEADELYADVLGEVYGAFDYQNIRANIPDYWNPTFTLFLQLYDKVFWYTEGTQLDALGEQLLLEVGAGSIQEYLNVGGKILITARFPTAFSDPAIANQSAILGFSPIDSFSTSEGQARIPIGAKAWPTDIWGGSVDTLVVNRFISGADPYYAKDPSDDLFKAEITPIQGWVGPETVAGRSLFSNGEPNQVFFSVELHKLNGDPDALKGLLSTILNEWFDW